MKKKMRSLGERGRKVKRTIFFLVTAVSFIAAVLTIHGHWPTISTFLCSVFSFLFLCPMQTINILECPQSVYAGEEFNVRVGWNNISSDWQLVANLEASETNDTQLVERNAKKTVSCSGEETFKLKVKPTTEIHDRAKVCARFYEGSELKNVFATRDIKVYPVRLNILNCSPLPVHGGEKLSVRIKWNNLTTNWCLDMSLEESETDKTNLADTSPTKIKSRKGEDTFKFTVDPTQKDHDQAMVRAYAYFYEGTEMKKVSAKKDLKVFKSKATVSIINCSPSPVHGGEDLNVKVSWDYIPIGWDLHVSLEESETDYTRLAEGGPNKIKSGKGETTIKFTVGLTERDHDQAIVCARFYKGQEKTNVFDKKDIRVLSSL
jgi:hypothetical protein